jgi:hypothetical protein
LLALSKRDWLLDPERDADQFLKLATKALQMFVETLIGNAK